MSGRASVGKGVAGANVIGFSVGLSVGNGVTGAGVGSSVGSSVRRMKRVGATVVFVPASTAPNRNTSAAAVCIILRR